MNLQHCKSASSEINSRSTRNVFQIGLIQEPWINNKTIQGIKNKHNTIIYNLTTARARAAIILDRTIKCLPLTDFITDDCVAVLIEAQRGLIKEDLVIASIYFPGDEPIINNTFTKLIKFCEKKNLIIGCDSNAHHIVWGSTDINIGGESLLDYLWENLMTRCYF